MQLNLTGHHVEITDSMRSYVQEKLSRLTRHFDHVTNVHVILSVEKLEQKAEATLHLAGNDVFAEAVDEDMYAAIDALVDKLDRQVIKYKEKLKSHRGNGARPAEPAEVTG
jgi:putative sigma-54 modulation protein